MAIINQSNILNLQPGITAPVVVHMSEGDSGTKLSFKLVDGVNAWTDPGNVVAAVHGRRQDGTQFGPYACTISGDVVSFETDAAMAGAAGSGIAEIVLTDSNGNSAGSANFAVMVERATFPMGVTYTNDVSVYEAILAYVQTIPAQVVDDYTAKIKAEAAERKATDTNLQNQISAEVATRAGQDATLSARMDEFTKLPDGSLSTAADAELVDIRVMIGGQSAETAGDAVRQQATEIKNETDNALSRLTTLDGEIYPIPMNFEIGSIYLSTSGWDYQELATRVRTKEGVTYHLMPGDVVGLTDYTNARFILGWRKTDGTYATQTWNQSNYYVQDEGDYVILITAVPEATVADKNNLLRLLFIRTNSKVADIQENLTDLTETVTDIDEQLPKRSVDEVLISGDDGGWTSGKFVYSTGIGANLITANYATMSYREYGAVKKGDVYSLENRAVGSGYGIYIVDDTGVVLERFEPTAELNYYYENQTYTVQHDGIMYLNGYSEMITNGKYRLFKWSQVIDIQGSPLKGVKWYSIGDSINEFNSTAEENWIRDMVNATGAVNTNVAKSGAGFYRGAPLSGQTQINYIKQLDSVGDDAELITVAGSFNDLMPSPWAALPVGTADDTGSASIAGYMNAFFDALISKFPTTAIAVVMTSPWDTLRPGVTASDSYVDVLKTICEKRGIPFCADCYYGCNLRPWVAANKTEYYTHSDGSVDGVHPNSKGHVYIYRMIRPFLEKCVHIV